MKTVLIADDNEVLIKALKIGLEKYKERFAPIFVGNGLEAMEVLNEKSVDMVITDIQMPMMDGLVLLAFMRENFPGVPVVIMSSYGTPDLKAELKNDILHFIDKPIHVDKLAQLILSVLEDGRRSAGSANRIAIADLLKLIMMGKKTCIFKLNNDAGSKGYFYFHEGELLNAVWDNLRGEEAIRQMLASENAEITFTRAPETKGKKQVDTDLDELLQMARASNLSVTSPQIKPKTKE